MTRKALTKLSMLLVCLLAALSNSAAWASHLRGTSVSWQPTATPGTVQFTLQYSQRASANGCTGNGGTCSVGTTIPVTLVFGDGASAVVTTTVTALNSAQDYFSSTGTVTHTYTGPGPYLAYYMDSARVSTIKSGSGAYLRMETTVTPFASPVNHPPVSSMPAIVTVPLQGTTGFFVSATDQDHDTLTYRLATAKEMYNLSAFSCAAQQPPGLSIDNTGQVTWDTTQITKAGCGFAAPASGDLWTVQFQVEDRDSNNVVKSKTPLDIIVQLVSSTEAPPTLQLSNAGPITVAPGTTISFNILGDDTTANSRVTLNASGIPVGATVTNTNQALIPPVTSTFTWTPTVAQAGSYVVAFTATNDTFQQTLSSITINVAKIQAPTATCSGALTAQYNVAIPVPLQISDPQGEAFSVVWSVDGTSARTDNVAAGGSATTLTYSPVFSTLGSHTVSITATNTDNVSSTCSTPITVNPADQSITFPAPANMTYGDADMALGGSASSGLAVSYAASGSCSIVNNAVHAGAAGSCSVTASQPGNSNYNAATSVTQTLTVAQHALTVTAADTSRAYGADNPAFLGSIAGVVNNDAITATYTTSAVPLSPVGSYAIVPNPAGAALANYAVTLKNGTLTVTQTATKVTVGPVPSSVVSGGNLGAVTGTVQDASGYTVTGSNALVTAVVTGPGGYSQTVSANSAAGVASLSLGSLALKTAGSYTVTLSSNGLGSSAASFSVVPGAASTLTTSSLASNIASGGNLGTLTATVQDSNGNTVVTSSASVTALVTGPDGFSQTVTGTAVNGVATLNLGSLSLKTAGVYTVATTSNGLTGASTTVTVTAGAAASVKTSTLPGTLVSGGNLGTLTATVVDASGNTVATSTAPVSVVVTGPNGYTQTVNAAAANGVASLNLGALSLKSAGTYTVTTSSNGLAGTTATVVVTAGAGSTLVTSATPASVLSGGNLGTLTATVEDANGNTVTTSAATVTATITGPNGFSQVITGAAVNGVASLNLSGLALKAAGTYTLTTSSNGLPAVTSTFTVGASAATQLATSGLPASITSGGSLGSLTATVEDANGNTVTTSAASISATVTGPNGFSQTVTGTAVNGVASLNLGALKLNNAGTYTVTTSSNGLAASTTLVTVAPSTATQLVVSGVPASITSGGNPGTITAKVEDATGNVVTNSNAAVSTTITGPDGYTQTINGSAVNGVASLNLGSLSLTKAGTYTLSTSSNGVPTATSTITVNPGAAAQVSLDAVPTNLTSGQSLGSISGTIKDANGNVVTNSSAQVTVTLTGPDGVAHTVTATAVNGVLSLDLSSLVPNAAGTYTLTVTGTGLTPMSSTLTVAPAAQTITLPSLPNTTYGAAGVTLPATTSAGLPITYTVSGPAVMNGSTLVATGAGPVTVTASQAGDAAHSATSVTKSFNVGQAASTATLSSSSAVVVSGTSVTLTAQVASPAGMPTGTVTFLNGTTVLGQGAVSSTGVASFSMATLPTGSLNLSASYSGDANFLAAVSPATAVAVQDFGIVPAVSTSAPVVPGTTAAFTLALTPGSSGFSSAITLSASGLPPGATYSFSPATLTPGSTAANTVLTVQTAKPVATARNLTGATGATFALLFLPFAVSRKTRAKLKDRRLLGVMSALLLMAGITGLTGCGASNGFIAQPEQSYTVTVTATSGKLVHTTTVVIDVQ